MPIDVIQQPASYSPSSHSNRQGRVRRFFQRFARKTASIAGSPWIFLGAVLLVVVWFVSRPLFSSFDTWQLVINTTTTIITFLMVFILQSSQNHDSKAIQLKLDELIRGVEGARTRLVNLQDLSDQELDDLENEFIELRKGLAQLEKKDAQLVAHPQ